MNTRVKRTVDIAMSNYENIVGCCAFTYEGKLAYFTENMNIPDDIPMIIEIWSTSGPLLIVKFITNRDFCQIKTLNLSGKFDDFREGGLVALVRLNKQ